MDAIFDERHIEIHQEPERLAEQTHMRRQQCPSPSARPEHQVYWHVHACGFRK
jgi:hypothetical protein